MRIAASDAFRGLVLSLAATAVSAPLTAVTYLPISDGELALRSPVIVRARVESVAVRLETIAGRQTPMSVVAFTRLDTLRGPASDEGFRVRLPGGRVGNLVSQVSGTPSFEEGQEVLLFLRPAPGRAGEFFLSEFGLGHFEIRTDAAGRRFAVRPEFSPDVDDYVSRRALRIQPESAGAPRRLRLADSLEGFLRTRKGAASPAVQYAVPQGNLADGRGRVRPLFVNIGGREPGNCGGTPCLFRWFWDTGASPNGVVTVSGTQSNLSDSSNGSATVANAVTKWTGVASSDVRYSGPTAGGNVSIQLDAPQSFDGGAAFNTPLPCGSGGVLGLGGTQNASGPQGGFTFKGDANYFAIQTGIVTMRKVTGSPGCYDVTTFLTAVLHEMGHTLGLGHPDQGQSTHSTTTASDWAAAVMHSVLPASHPSAPQTDDIQAIQFYYGTGAPPPTSTPTLSVTPTRTPTGTSQSSPRGRVTPLHPPTPKTNVSGRQ